MDVWCLRQAKHFAPFAQGVYGWPLKIWDHSFRALCCCDAVPLGCGRPSPEGHCGWGYRYSRGVIRHAGCCNGFCCMASAKAFLSYTHIPQSDILRANTRARYGEVCYVVAYDRAVNAVVVGVRGTMSVAETVTDLDTMPEPVPGGGYAHRGMLVTARWLLHDLGYDHAGRPRDDAEWSLSATAAALGARVVLVGHSLGAGVSTVSTLLLREAIPNILCFAFGPPPTLDPVLADAARAHVVSVVYKHDMIARLSLASVFRLKQQMVNAFKVCIESKFDIVRHKIKGRYEDMFLTTPHWDLSEGFRETELAAIARNPENPDEIPESGADADAESSSDGEAIRAGLERARDGALAASEARPDDIMTSEPVGTDHAAPTAAQAEDAAARLGLGVGDALGLPRVPARQAVDIVPMHVAGRIYHLLPGEPRRARCFRGRRRLVAYPAHPDSFDELYVAGSMFADHMPVKYDCTNLDVDAIEEASKEYNQL
jgi:pimeloyl-ACP methyl ester carboxylesterase